MQTIGANITGFLGFTHCDETVFRGQVVPTNTRTRSEVEILSTTRDDRGVLIVFQGSFWVDDLRIYETQGMGVRVLSR